MKTEYGLYALGVFVLVGSNLSLLYSGWLAEFEQLPPATGIFILDLLLHFFPAMYENAATRLVNDLLFSFAGVGIAALVFEGSRLPRFNKYVLALYMPIAQFVAIGFATPLFFGLALRVAAASPKQEERLPVPAVVSYTMLLTILVCGGIMPQLEQAFANKNLEWVIVFLLLPVVTVSVSVLLTRYRKRDSLRAREMVFQILFLFGLFTHAKMLYTVFTQPLSLNMVFSNPPCVFLLFDVFGVIVATYMWLRQQQGEKKMSREDMLLRILVLGPTADCALQCLSIP